MHVHIAERGSITQRPCHKLAGIRLPQVRVLKIPILPFVDTPQEVSQLGTPPPILQRSAHRFSAKLPRRVLAT
jgi:hypothetical protein